MWNTNPTTIRRVKLFRIHTGRFRYSLLRLSLQMDKGDHCHIPKCTSQYKFRNKLILNFFKYQKPGNSRFKWQCIKVFCFRLSCNISENHASFDVSRLTTFIHLREFSWPSYKNQLYRMSNDLFVRCRWPLDMWLDVGCCSLLDHQRMKTIASRGNKI